MPRRLGRTGQLLVSIAAAIAIVAGVAVVAGVIVVRTVLLHPQTYTTALARAEAFDRIYTDVLADPELAATKDELLGELGIPPELAVQARALAVNAARWVLPPATLQRMADMTITEVLAYIRGDRPRLDVDVAVDELAARIPTATLREVRSLLASAVDRAVSTTDELSAAVRDLADQLAAGQLPASVPKLGGTTFDATEVATAILDGLGDDVDDDVRRMVLGTVLAGDQRDAVIDGAALAVTGHASAVADRLRAEPSIDVVAAIAEQARRPVADVVATLDDARAMARWTGPWTLVAGLLVAAAGVVALLWVRGWSATAARWIGASLLGAGVAIFVGWLLVRLTVTSPLVAGATAGDGGWDLPAPVAALVADIADVVGSRVAAIVWRTAAVFGLIGGGLVIGGSGVRLGTTVTIRRLASGGLAAVVLIGLSVVVRTRPTDERACNGHVELCDRRYDDVTYAATHNSMSSPDVVPVWPEHDGGITDQLEAGVRALLIDTHHWTPLESAGQLAAFVAPGEPRLPSALADVLYEQLVTVRDGRPGAFLCHIHCAFGAQPLSEGLGEIADFLAANPGEVVTLIIQDDIPAAETEAAFVGAGLTDDVYPQDPEAEWPTLGELIDRGQRLVVFAENEGPPPEWYANAFASMQETPFLFLSPDDFSCAENRGDPDASLFQMNHWVQRIAPDRADSAVVNRLDVLVDRARRCERERGLRANYLAVNFYDIGDVVAAADVLNGVGVPER